MSEHDSRDDVAIVGLAGRFPAAPDVSTFWDNLCAGVSGRVVITRDDLVAAGEDPSVLDDPDYVAAAFPLEDAECFDAEFFGYTPREAELMDPQQRILLEVAWNALEDAGVEPARHTGRIGVFGGVGRNAYLLTNLLTHEALRRSAAEYHMLIGNERDFPCTHIAYRLGLRGPAVNVQTACSTSGVAIHLACQSLLAGECDLALAGGAKILVPNRVGYWHVEGGPLASDGEVRAFDAHATGMVRGSGAAMLALKRLDDALGDRDHVYAVVRGSAINNDGGARAGFTAPSASGQAQVIAEALEVAGVDADEIGLLEAHGTGTVLGDPIEVEGLTRAFARSTQRRGFCALGSVKTNIGHLDAGATVAGVIKAALALDRERIPPSLHFAEPNPQIDFAATPFTVPRECTDWPRGARPRLAGISSFGLGGTNAHIVLGEAPIASPSGPSRPAQLLVLSARSQAALDRNAGALADHLERSPALDLADAAHSLRVGRRRFGERIALLASSHADAVRLLRERPPREVLRAAAAPEDVPCAFLFAGGGAQYAGMARGLHEQEDVFREALEDCHRHYEARTGDSLLERIFGGASDLERPSLALPALFAIEYATACLWRSIGVEPDAVIGHSMGEYTAACVAGVLTMPEALDVVICRGRLFDRLESGAMLSVPLDEAALRDRIGDTLSIAAINRPDQCVVSGRSSDVAALEGALAAEGVETRRVHISVAAHSALVEPILEEFGEQLRRVDWQPPRIPLVSNLSGRWIRDEEATDPDYWVRHLRGTVRFAEGLACLLEEPDRILIESGPGQTLSTLARQHPARGARHTVVASIRHPQEDADDGAFWQLALARVWLAGGVVDWERFVASEARARVPLPGYAFERTRHWIDALDSSGMEGRASAATSVAGAETAAPEPLAEPTAAEVEPADRHSRILVALKGILSELSGRPAAEIDEHATFLELGFDSLFLTQANAAFKKRFKVRLTARQLMEKTPVLDALAGHLDEVLPADARFAAPGAAGAPVTPTGPRPPVIAEPPTISRTPSGAVPLTALQEQHIDALIAETVHRTPESKKITQRARAALADPRTVQGFRSRWKEMIYPLVSDRAEGSKIWDVDGNEYVDLVCGYGVTFLGHRPPLVERALREQLGRTLAIGPQTPLAGEAADLVRELTGVERVAFCNTGSEAVLAAIRMARTVTGNDKIAKFDGHYHGIFDEVQVKGSGSGSRKTTLPSAPGIPAEAVANTVILDYGDEAAFDVIRERAHELALVMVEPVRSRNPDYQPKEYLQKLRAVTRELGLPLLFDEMVTGFRSHPGGAQAIFDVKADIVTYGKVVGGGMPIGVVAGDAAYMDALDGGYWEFGDDSLPEADMTWFAGTFVRHPLALAATCATLRHLRDEGPSLQERVNEHARQLAERLNAHFEHVRAPLRVERFASVLRVTFTEYQEYGDLLFAHLRNRGVLTYNDRPAFLTTAHDQTDLDRVHEAFVASIDALQQVGLLAGGDPDALRILPLTDGQQEIWIASQFGRDASCSYNLCSTLALRGELDRSSLEDALERLVARHESLRAVPSADGTTQRILPSLALRPDYEDLRGLSPDARDRRVDEVGQREVHEPFDLIEGPLVRVRLLRRGEHDHLLLLTVHHLAADGWSCGVLLRDLGELYTELAAGREPQLRAPRQLSDFVAFQNEPDTREAEAAAEAYWMEQYAGALPRLEFPSDRTRPPIKSFAARRFELPVAAETAARLREIARANGTTLFAALMAGFAAYLTRITGQVDHAIGFSAAGQPLAGDPDLVGHCVNFLPLRLRAEPEEAFADQLRAAGSVMLDAMDNQSFHFGTLVQKLAPERDASRVPLVSVGLNLDASSKGVRFGELTASAGSIGRAYENLDIFVNFAELESGIELQCTFATELFDETTMRARMAEYLRLLDAASRAPESAIADLALLAETQRASLATWGEGAQWSPSGVSVPSQIREQARLTPDAIAVADGDGTLRYAELVRRADSLGHALRAIGPGRAVAVCAPRCAELVVGLLAVLETGAAYVPIDPANPLERIRQILADSGARVLLTHSSMAADLARTGVELLELDRLSSEGPAPLDADPPAPTDLESPAYIHYTSGSTGVPKGVAVSHRAMAHYLEWAAERYLGDGPGAPLHSSIGFDLTVTSLWAPLLRGRTVTVLPARENLGPLGDYLAANPRFGLLKLTPSHLTVLAHQLRDETLARLAGTLVVGGERLLWETVAFLRERAPDVLIVNEYGPTEATVGCCTFEIGPDAPGASVPIGRPTPGTRLHVLDARMQPVPVGVAGELYIAGAQLALGYWQRPDLTEAAFVHHPATGERLYRTGDWVRYLATGDLEYLGRRDDQVKIRGHRVELGEVESVLASHPRVAEVAVVPFEREANDAVLVAYVGERVREAAALGEDAHQDEWRNRWAALYSAGARRVAQGEHEQLDDLALLGELSDRDDYGPEVREGLDATFERLLAFEPRRVLDIGCGTGAVLMRLAPLCEQVLGTDSSGTAIAEVERQLREAGGLPGARIELREQPAHVFDGIASGAFDTVLLNSVSQYFPSSRYFAEVLEGAVAATSAPGRVFVGDVQSFALLETHHASDLVERSAADTDLATLREIVATRVANEDELVVDPAFFVDLAARLPRVTRIELLHRRGRIQNETTRFHYDVVLHVEPEPVTPLAPEWITWSEAGPSIRRIAERVAEDGRTRAVADIPNARLQKQLRARDLLRDEDAPSTSADIQKALESSPAGVDPEALWELEAELPVRIAVRFCDEVGDGRCEAVISPRATPPAAAYVAPRVQAGTKPWANEPAAKQAREVLIAELRAGAEAALPLYMRPDAYVVLDRLPLNANGKVDRDALPSPSFARRAAGEAVAPRSETEARIAEIWTRVVGVPDVSVLDNFFQIGGHSLLAVQVIVQIREAFEIELPLAALFELPTVAQLAERVDGLLYSRSRPSPDGDHEEISI